MNRFTVYDGKFLCQKCGIEVSKLRLWSDTLDLTWFCESKHISRLSFTSWAKQRYKRTSSV